MRTTRFLIALAATCTALSAATAWSADDAAPQPPAAGAPQAAVPPGPAPLTPPPDKKPAEATPASVPPPSVTVIDAVDAHGILGRDVRSSTDENMGRIADVIVDRNGQARAVVIDFGGFLGVGSRKIVVDWSALHFNDVANKGQSITLALTREQVRAAPEYKDDQPIVVLGASGSLERWRFPPMPQDK